MSNKIAPTYILKVDLTGCKAGAIYQWHDDVQRYVGFYEPVFVSHNTIPTLGKNIEVLMKEQVECVPSLFESIGDSGISVCEKCKELSV